MNYKHEIPTQVSSAHMSVVQILGMILGILPTPYPLPPTLNPQRASGRRSQSDRVASSAGPRAGGGSSIMNTNTQAPTASPP
jgi:hypothetical protein